MSARHMLLIPVEGPTQLVDVGAGDDAFRTMAAAIGADYIERVRVGTEWSMAVDEEGLLRRRQVNPRASLLYGTPNHGYPICGDVLLGVEGFRGDGLDWLDTAEAAAREFLSDRGVVA